jgi:DNA replicative helicase MCM subunit Mcm2 (Cdc46/Mcm family)
VGHCLLRWIINILKEFEKKIYLCITKFILYKTKKMTVQHTYDHVANFLATMNPQKILELKAPQEMSSRLELLLRKEKGLSPEEKDELDHYIVLERLIRLSKAHARIQLNAIEA